MTFERTYLVRKGKNMSKEELERRIRSCEEDMQAAMTPIGGEFDEELYNEAQKELHELLALRESGLK